MTFLEEDFDTAPARNVGGRPRKNGDGRLRKLECARCGFIGYASTASLHRGRPECCGERLELANLRDREAVEYDELTPRERDLAATEQGFRTEAQRAASAARKVSRSGSRPRCAYGPCTRYVAHGAGGYCNEHANHAPAVGAAYKGRAA